MVRAGKREDEGAAMQRIKQSMVEGIETALSLLATANSADLLDASKINVSWEL